AEGDAARAVMHFEAALAANARLGARPALARTQYEYARLLLRQSRPEDRERARALRAAALELAEGCGMVRLVDELAELTVAGPVDAASVPSPEAAAAPAAGTPAVLRHDVDFWTIGDGPEAFPLK